MFLAFLGKQLLAGLVMSQNVAGKMIAARRSRATIIRENNFGDTFALEIRDIGNAAQDPEAAIMERKPEISEIPENQKQAVRRFLVEQEQRELRYYRERFKPYAERLESIIELWEQVPTDRYLAIHFQSRTIVLEGEPKPFVNLHPILIFGFGLLYGMRQLWLQDFVDGPGLTGPKFASFLKPVATRRTFQRYLAAAPPALRAIVDNRKGYALKLSR